MNKRVMKVIEKLQTGNKKVVAFRRDQFKKAIEENAFDSMKTYDYDELKNPGRKTILNPTLKDIEISWLENGDIWATLENNTLEVVVKYGYSTRRFYFDTMKEYKEEYNNIDLEASPEDDELLKVEVIEEVKTVEPVHEQPQEQENKVVNLFDYKNKKAIKQEIKQPKKNNKINLCVCGSILKGEEENKMGICKNCIEYVYNMYLDGTLKDRDEKLYNMIHEAMTK